jgi:PAS domain S-box-containing protein
VGNTFVRRMVEAIESDYAGALTLRGLAASIGRQPSYLGRLFRQDVGASVREYLTRVRLERAAALVRDGIKIEAIALSVGYRSKKNFYQQFKRRYGVTPLSYRHDARSDRSSNANSEPLRALSGHERAAGVGEAAIPHGAPTENLPQVEPVLGRLASIVRASTRAWQLAIKTQRIMVAHFARCRVPMLLTDDAGRYISANPAAVSVTGYTSSELYGLCPSDLFLRAPARDTRCIWQLVLLAVPRSNRAPNATVRRKSGDSRDVYLVTLNNVLWGRQELSAIIEAPRLAG